MKVYSAVFALLTIPFLSPCASASSIEPRFINSVVSHNIDLIRPSDPTVSADYEYVETGRREMPDRRNDVLFDDSSFVFTLNYEDQTSVEIWAHSDFTSVQDAKRYVSLLLEPLGKLPTPMRATLNHVVLHKGNETAFAEHLGHFFILYSENIDKRVQDNDLEETIFHESVHATLDHTILNDSYWHLAQRKDNVFVTDYAKQNPAKEDLAETALLAYSYFINKEKLPIDLSEWLETNIPNRLGYLTEVFDKMGVVRASSASK